MPARCNVVVLISGAGSNLQALIDASARPDTPIQISAVVSNRADAYGLERARQASIEAHALDHTQFTDRQAFDAALIELIDRFEPDLLVLAGFMRILTERFVTHYKGCLLNIHPSLLPLYTGLRTHQRALDAGDLEHGCSVHFVTEELDGGPVVVQAVVPIHAGDTAETLAQRVHEQEHVIYPLAVSWFAQGRLRLTERGAELDDQLLPDTGHVIRS